MFRGHGRIHPVAAVMAAGLLAMVAAGPAMAQLARGTSETLSEEEVRSALFGIDMEGYSPSYGFRWRECIGPDGGTLYETPYETLRGRLTVEAGGYACFAYENDNFSEPACFRVKRTGNGFTFNGVFADVFVTTRVITGVQKCEAEDLVG